MIPEALPGGRPRKTDLRSAINAILYLLRTGCPRRYLPRDSFPPRSTVYNIFCKFQREGVCGCREPQRKGWPRGQIGRKGGGNDGQVGYDAGKRVKRRKVDMAAAKVPRLRLEIVRRSGDIKDFVVLPRRWVVERTFS